MGFDDCVSCCERAFFGMRNGSYRVVINALSSPDMGFIMVWYGQYRKLMTGKAMCNHCLSRLFYGFRAISVFCFASRDGDFSALSVKLKFNVMRAACALIS